SVSLHKISIVCKLAYFFHIFKSRIYHPEVTDRRAFNTAYFKNSFCTLTKYVSNLNITHYRIKRSGITLFVMEIYIQRVLHFTNSDIAKINIFDEAAAYGIGFKTNAA